MGLARSTYYDRSETVADDTAIVEALFALPSRFVYVAIILDAWSRLQFIVHNEGYGSARNLIIRARGDQFEGQVAATRQILTLRAGRGRTDWLDVVLCHEGNIEDPSIYLEAFEVLKQRGRIRAYGISTDSLEALKRFNVNNACSVVQLNYSLLNRTPEADMLPYCQEHGIAVMVRGPLAMGLLSGNYSTDTVFTDSVRARWHQDEESQAAFERKVAQVEKLEQVVKPANNPKRACQYSSAFERRRAIGLNYV